MNVIKIVENYFSNRNVNYTFRGINKDGYFQFEQNFIFSYMSKRELKKYLNGLEKKHLEEQLIDLYDRFKNVKVYYDFVFNPKEEKLLEESKLKISNEYFPVNRRKAKARRSVAQKYIKHFISLGVDSSIIVDVMLYNIEIAQIFVANKTKVPESFYKSMLNSFDQSVKFIKQEGLYNSFKKRIEAIINEINKQNWPNRRAFILKI